MDMTFKNIKGAIGEFEQIKKNLQNPTEIMAVTAGLIVGDVVDHFDKSKRPGGNWKPVKFREGSPLKDRGGLRNSIQPFYGKKFAGAYSDLKYAAVHNYGHKFKITDKMRRFFWAKYYKSGKKETHWKNLALKRGRIIIPQRKFMWLGRKARNEIVKHIGSFIVEAS